jgi:hypothetical protein
MASKNTPQKYSAKLTSEAVLEMRLMREKGASFGVLARVFGVSKPTARRAVAGKNWKRLTLTKEGEP